MIYGKWKHYVNENIFVRKIIIEHKDSKICPLYESLINFKKTLIVEKQSKKEIEKKKLQRQDKIVDDSQKFNDKLWNFLQLNYPYNANELYLAAESNIDTNAASIRNHKPKYIPDSFYSHASINGKPLPNEKTFGIIQYEINTESENQIETDDENQTNVKPEKIVKKGVIRISNHKIDFNTISSNFPNMDFILSFVLNNDTEMDAFSLKNTDTNLVVYEYIFTDDNAKPYKLEELAQEINTMIKTGNLTPAFNYAMDYNVIKNVITKDNYVTAHTPNAIVIFEKSGDLDTYIDFLTKNVEEYGKGFNCIYRKKAVENIQIYQNVKGQYKEMVDKIQNGTKEKNASHQLYMLGKKYIAAIENIKTTMQNDELFQLHLNNLHSNIKQIKQSQKVDVPKKETVILKLFTAEKFKEKLNNIVNANYQNIEKITNQINEKYKNKANNETNQKLKEQELDDVKKLKDLYVTEELIIDEIIENIDNYVTNKTTKIHKNNTEEFNGIFNKSYNQNLYQLVINTYNDALEQFDMSEETFPELTKLINNNAIDENNIFGQKPICEMMKKMGLIV